MPEVVGGTVVEFLVQGVVNTEETVNRYFYQATAPVGTLIDLIDEFKSVVLDVLVTCMSNVAGFTSVTVTQRRGGTSFASSPIVDIGQVAGDALPPYAAFDFTLVRGGAGERNGYKRIAGVAEASQVNGIPTAGSLAVLGPCADAMFAHLLPAGDDWQPVIQRKTIGHVPQLTPKYYDVSSVIFSRIGTQNSRKYGHGR